LQKLNEQLQQKLYNFQKLYEDEHRKLQFGNKIESFIAAYISGRPRKELVKDFVKILEQEKFKKLDTNKDESKKLQIIKRKVTQELKKVEVIEKISENNEKLETQKKEDRKLWIKKGQRVRIQGSTATGTIEEVLKNGKVIINYGAFKTQITSEDLERI
jgi:DNA mismatch repair protein MutS2